MAQNKVFRGTARKQIVTPIGNRCFFYHQTMVCEGYVDGKVLLNSGGYRTATTKLAMNQALSELGRPERVVQVKGQWLVGDRPFADGMILN